jgi:DNA transformation protein
MTNKNAKSEFVEYLSDVFRAFGTVEPRRMFGGYGIYHHNLIFGISVDDVLYLKTDDVSISAFMAAGCTPFAYEKKGEFTQTSYYTIPAESFDDPEAARKWATLAFEASVRVNARKKQKQRKSRE